MVKATLTIAEPVSVEVPVRTRGPQKEDSLTPYLPIPLPVNVVLVADTWTRIKFRRVMMQVIIRSHLILRLSDA